jgi:hypothetical protein
MSVEREVLTMFRITFFAKALAFALVALTAYWTAAQAQGPGKPMEPPRDPALETASRHNLDVARWYLVKRKAYEGARDRLQ